MKKISTLLGLFLLTGAAVASAETVTMTVEKNNESKWDYDFVKVNVTYTSEITSSNGVYTIANFFNSGEPLTFTFDPLTVTATSQTPIICSGNIREEKVWGTPNYYLLKKDSEEPAVIKTKDADGAAVELKNPDIFGAQDATYVQLADKATTGGNYYACIQVNSDYPDAYRVCFYFNGSETNIERNNVTTNILDAAGTQIYKSYDSEIASNDGKYTITNVLNTIYPLTFSFDFNETGTATMNFFGNVKEAEINDATCYYIMVPNTQNENIQGKVYDFTTGDLFWFQSPYIVNVNSATYVKKVDAAEHNGNNYMAHIKVVGNSGSSEAFLEFYFAGPEQSGIFDVAADDENAPVEFYNLSGQRVENPANGIFIRKQGSKVQKVVIR
ncbi:MAG: hypothetical protein K2K77_01580 [Duncaniella sp.]|nr:hypothetical protein [Duncaniella sp.]